MKILSPVTNIIIESPKKFEQTVKGFKEVAKYPNYKLKDAVISDKNKFTMYGNTCTILGMSNGKNTYLGHFAPEQKTTDFKNKLDYIVKKFQDQTGHLSAIITGAFDKNIITPLPKQAKESFEQMAEVGEILDKNNAILSMISGKTTPSFMDNLAVTKDNFILSHFPKKEGLEPMKNYPDNMDLESFLQDKYSVVEIAPEHKINFLQ